MGTRVTQALLAVIAMLLAALVWRPNGIVPVAGAQSTSAVADVLRARSIEVVGQNGQVVAQLYTSEDGGGQLRMRSGGGVVRVKLGTAPDGSALILMDEDAEPAVWLATARAGTTVTLAEKGKEKRVLTP